MEQIDEVMLREMIIGEVERFVREDRSNRLDLDGVPIYIVPIVGFVSGNDPIFK
jgi:hypothetical protein